VSHGCNFSVSIVRAHVHVLESSGYPPVQNPILESKVQHSFCSLAIKPVLALELELSERRPGDQSASSKCHDSVRCCDIVERILVTPDNYSDINMNFA